MWERISKEQMRKQINKIMNKKEVDRHLKHLTKEDLRLTQALYLGMERIAQELLETQQKVLELDNYIKLNMGRKTPYIN